MSILYKFLIPVLNHIVKLYLEKYYKGQKIHENFMEYLKVYDKTHSVSAELAVDHNSVNQEIEDYKRKG